MSNQVDIDPSLTIVAQGIMPYPPALLRIAQQGKFVQVVVSPPQLTSVNIVTTLAIYRSSTPNGPWTPVDNRQISDISIPNNLYDSSPVYGRTQYYAATAIDSANNESPKTPALDYTASAATAAAASS